MFYENAKGNRPFEEFIDQLDAVALKNKDARIQLEQIIYCLNRLENQGTRAGEKFTKRISGDIWELRPGVNRILFFGWNGNQFILLHHFAKTTQKTPLKRSLLLLDVWMTCLALDMRLSLHGMEEAASLV